MKIIKPLIYIWIALLISSCKKPNKVREFYMLQSRDTALVGWWDCSAGNTGWSYLEFQDIICRYYNSMNDGGISSTWHYYWYNAGNKLMKYYDADSKYSPIPAYESASYYKILEDTLYFKNPSAPCGHTEKNPWYVIGVRCLTPPYELMNYYRITSTSDSLSFKSRPSLGYMEIKNLSDLSEISAIRSPRR